MSGEREKRVIPSVAREAFILSAAKDLSNSSREILHCVQDDNADHRNTGCLVHHAAGLIWPGTNMDREDGKLVGRIENGPARTTFAG